MAGRSALQRTDPLAILPCSIRNFLLPHFIAHPELSSPYFSLMPDGTPDYVSSRTRRHPLYRERRS